MSDSPVSIEHQALRSDAMLEFLMELEANPHNFDLFATLRRLECATAPKPRLGQSVRPGEDAVRIGQEPTLAFAPSQIASYDRSGRSKAPRLLVYAPGVFGPNGPLPVHLTEYLRDRMRNYDDPTMWRFVDLFHHRMLSLLYRAWANTQPTVNADREDDDRFTTYVASLAGMGMESLRDRDAFPDHGRFHYVGHFARQCRSPQGLVSAIEDFFNLDATLEEFTGDWLKIPREGWWRLGEPRRDAGLGLGTTIGESVWSSQHKFRLKFGPLDFATFQNFMPGRKSMERLIALVRTYCGDEYDWDLQLILKKDEVPALSLGRQGQLGRTSWLNSDERQGDVADTHLQPLAGLWHTRAA